MLRWYNGNEKKKSHSPVLFHSASIGKYTVETVIENDDARRPDNDIQLFVGFIFSRSLPRSRWLSFSSVFDSCPHSLVSFVFALLFLFSVFSNAITTFKSFLPCISIIVYERKTNNNWTQSERKKRFVAQYHIAAAVGNGSNGDDDGKDISLFSSFQPAKRLMNFALFAISCNWKCRGENR